MRLDKYLQVTGLIKRRVLASEACRRGLVKVNGVAVKPTREVAVGDSIIITLARREIEVKVLQEIKGSSLKKTLRSEYFETVRDVAITPVSELDDFWAEDSKDD
ncbi:MAG: S4 domain-containing protein [Candidatus Rifleibacteriota bacterium]